MSGNGILTDTKLNGQNSTVFSENSIKSLIQLKSGVELCVKLEGWTVGYRFYGRNGRRWTAAQVEETPGGGQTPFPKLDR